MRPKRNFVSPIASQSAAADVRFAGAPSGVQPVVSADSDDIDRAFEQLASGAAPLGSGHAGGWDPHAALESAALLRQILLDQLGTLRLHIRELARGSAKQGWIETARRLLTDLRKAAEVLEPSPLLPGLLELEALVEQTAAQRPRTIDRRSRAALQAVHERLEAAVSRLLDLPSEPLDGPSSHA